MATLANAVTVPEPKRFSGNQGGSFNTQGCANLPKRIVGRQIPDDILLNESLIEAIRVLPQNYNFEIMKTLWRIREIGAKSIAIQFPEGLLMYACIICDILRDFGGCDDTFIMGDVTYGACCVDDFTAEKMGADFLVHYGHSCLVPITKTKIPCMYVFVDVKIDMTNFLDTFELNFDCQENIALAGTIQFTSSLQNSKYGTVMQYAKQQLEEKGFGNLIIPQVRPLSSGETLGCTALKLSSSVEKLVFVADGRFHLEAILIANPGIPAFRYDPYGRTMTTEAYDHKGMQDYRRLSIERARTAKSWGLIMGTLGRQGNPAVVDKLEKLLQAQGVKYTLVLMREVTPGILQKIPDVDAWIQVACPRLSIDWGEGFHKPTLTPYEAMVCFRAVPAWWESGQKSQFGDINAYPMDYYARDGGPWSSSYTKERNTRHRVNMAPSADKPMGSDVQSSCPCK